MHEQTSGKRANDRLRRERLIRGWSQQEVADRVGTDGNTISRWERGITIPSPYFRQKLCEIFAKNVQELGLLSELPNGEVPPQAYATQQIISVPSLQPGLSSYWSVPAQRNMFFTGREAQLQQLHHLLHPRHQTIPPQSYALTGLGGIGKTQLALEYAYRSFADYSAVFWIGAETHESLLSGLVLAARCLDLPEQRELDQHQIVAAVLRWLNTHANWLVIFDNLEDLELIRLFLPSTRQGSLLFTTRLQSLDTLALPLPVEPMTGEEGINLLLRRSGCLELDGEQLSLAPGDALAASTLVDALGGLPLALDQAGAYIQKTHSSLTEFTQIFAVYSLHVLQERDRLADHPASVVSTFILAFERLQQTNPAAADLLTACCFLAPDAIPEVLIREHLADEDLPLHALVRQPLQWNALCTEMLTLSLISRSSQTQTFTIHRLVQKVLTSHLSEEMHRQWAQRVLHMLYQAFPAESLLRDVDRWPWCEQILPHALWVIRQQEIEHPAPMEWIAERRELLTSIASYLVMRARYEEAEPLFQRVLAREEQHGEPESIEVATALANLGDLYRRQGRYEEAVRSMERAQHIRERALGQEHPHVGSLLNALGKLQWRLGRYHEAEQLFRRALLIQERSADSESLDIAYTLNSLAVVTYTQGHYQKAEALYQRSIRVRETVLGSHHPDLAIALSNLGIIYHKQKRYQEAESYYQRAIDIREHSQGAQHPDLAFPLNNLATIYYEQERYQEAEALYQRSISIREQALGPQHPDLANPLSNLADTYVHLGRFEEAERLFQRSVQILEQSVGKDHPEIWEPLYGLAELYCRLERYGEAEKLYQHIVALWEQTIDPTHPKLAEILQSYAGLLHRLHREDEAQCYEDRARIIRESIAH